MQGSRNDCRGHSGRPGPSGGDGRLTAGNSQVTGESRGPIGGTSLGAAPARRGGDLVACHLKQVGEQVGRSGETSRASGQRVRAAGGAGVTLERVPVKEIGFGLAKTAASSAVGLGSRRRSQRSQRSYGHLHPWVSGDPRAPPGGVWLCHRLYTPPAVINSSQDVMLRG